MSQEHLQPHQVVLDLVLKYSSTMPKLGEAAIFGPNMVFAIKNHLGQYVSMTVPINYDGDVRDGSDPRFVLFQLGPTVWKLAPSVLHQTLHAYITIVGVPEGWSP